MCLYVYIYTDCYIKISWDLKIENTQEIHTQIKSNPNITLKIVIKSQEKNRGREEKRHIKTNPKHLKRWLQPKDIDWLNGYKNKICIYVVYKRPTSDLGTHTD